MCVLLLRSPAARSSPGYNFVIIVIYGTDRLIKMEKSLLVFNISMDALASEYTVSVNVSNHICHTSL